MCVVVATVTATSVQFETLRGRNAVIRFTVTKAFPEIDNKRTRWYFEDTEIVSDSGNYTISPDTLSLTVHTTTIASEGRYSIAVTNAAGTSMGHALLKVYGM